MQTVTVRVTCDTGNSWTTRINTTFAEARRYFIGQQFTREYDDGREVVDTVINVEEVESCE